MTVSTSYAPLEYAGNGATTAFSVTWQFLTGSLVVTLIDASDVEVIKTISTHYTVSGGTDASGLPSTGTVTMVTAPATGETLRIERVTAKTQAATFTNNDAFPAKTIEAAFDKGVLIGQETLISIPALAGNAGKILAVNAAEDDAEWIAGVALAIGTVTTGAAGSSALATITSDGAGGFDLDLTIPRGDTGASGAGTGDMLAANNLSDVASVATSRTNLGVGTGDSPQFAGVNIGHATDTTLTRVSAGVAAIEGSNILLASGLGSVTQAYSANLAAVAAVTVTAAGTALLDDANAAAQRTTLGLGTAAVLNVGTAANNIVQLDGTAKLPAVDGSALTNIPGGKLVQRAYASYAGVDELSTAIPRDDTVPQIGEGTEVLTVAIAPTSTSNRIRITVSGFAIVYATGCGAAAVLGTIALFRDAVSGALTAKSVGADGGIGVGSPTDVGFVFEHAPSTTSTITYRLRAGATGGADRMRFNATGAGTRLYGGIASLNIIAEEIAP